VIERINSTTTSVYADHVGGAVIMKWSLQEFSQWPSSSDEHEHQPSAANRQVKPTNLHCDSACILLSYIPTVNVIWYHLTWKQIMSLILLSHWE